MRFELNACVLRPSITVEDDIAADISLFWLHLINNLVLNNKQRAIYRLASLPNLHEVKYNNFRLSTCITDHKSVRSFYIKVRLIIVFNTATT